MYIYIYMYVNTCQPVLEEEVLKCQVWGEEVCKYVSASVFKHRSSRLLPFRGVTYFLESPPKLL